jgi:sugar phosphate isomerase/epimerase
MPPVPAGRPYSADPVVATFSEEQRMPKTMSRRKMLISTSAAVGTALSAKLAKPVRAAAVGGPDSPFSFCLNTSTISGQKLPLVDEIELAARVGFTSIEPWIREIEEYQKTGGKLPDLRKRISDLGLTVEDTIGFAQWIVDDNAARKKALEQAKRDMDLSVQIGAKRIAAPPAGATDRTDMDLRTIAERYRALCDLGDKMGIVAMVEVWGFSKTLQRLGEATMVAIESGHPKACILTDVYHLYKGGSDPTNLKLLSKEAIQIMHFNDYPAQPTQAKIDDSHRVFPGDGIAPIAQILRDIKNMGGHCILSLELFNRQYWKLDAMVCAKTGFAKMKDAVAKAVGG